MSFEFKGKVSQVKRSVTARHHEKQSLKAVVLSRSFPTTVEDLWSSLTSSERLKHCFLPIQGDLHLGGRFQLEGNAAGTILECVPRQRLAMTWEFGGGMSILEIDFAIESSKAARLVLSHHCPIDEHWQQYGPGAAGVGWDMALLGLDVYFASGGVRLDESVFVAPEAKKFIVAVTEDWARADIVAGENPEQAQVAASKTKAFYTGEA